MNIRQFEFIGERKWSNTDPCGDAWDPSSYGVVQNEETLNISICKDRLGPANSWSRLGQFQNLPMRLIYKLHNYQQNIVIFLCFFQLK